MTSAWKNCRVVVDWRRDDTHVTPLNVKTWSYEPQNPLDSIYTKANLRDLIAATGPMTLYWPVWPWLWTDYLNNAHHLCPTKLCALFQSHLWIKTEVIAWWKRCNRSQIGDIFSHVWPWNLTDDFEKKTQPNKGFDGKIIPQILL